MGLHPSSFRKQVGVGKFELLGKYAGAEFTDGLITPLVRHPSYRQKTTEVDFDYIIKQFDARLMSFFKDTRFNAVNSEFLGGRRRPAVPDFQGYSLANLRRNR